MKSQRGVAKLDIKNFPEALDKLEDKKIQQLRFGLTSDNFPIGTAKVELPFIVAVIQDARYGKDTDLLKRELAAHGIVDENLTIIQMAYILFRIAGCTQDELKLDLGLSNGDKEVARILNETIQQMDKKKLERKMFMLENPQLDYTKEKIGIETIPNLEDMLLKIKEVSGLEATEIFNPANIPEYLPRKHVKHFKSKEHRSLKEVLYEVYLALINPNWREIQRLLVGKKKHNIIHIITNGNLLYAKRDNMMSLKFIKVLAKKRMEFQQSPKAKTYPIDRVNWQETLDRAEAIEKADLQK